MTAALRFFWNATRGCRLRPWRSEYLRWRLETFTGIPAPEISARDFWTLLRSERAQVLRYLGWLVEMRRYAASAPPQE